MIRSEPVHDGQVAASVAIALNRGRDAENHYATVMWEGMGLDPQIVGEWRRPVVMLASGDRMFVLRIEEMEGPFVDTFKVTFPPGMCDHAILRPTCRCPK